MKVHQYLIILLIVIIVPFVFSVILSFLKEYKKGNKPTGHINKLHKDGIIKRIYVQFPKVLAHDYMTRNLEEFKDTGVRLIVGEQGSGKTITACKMLRDYKLKYPKIHIKSNTYYKYQDAPINGPEDIIMSNNGMYGEIDFIDEIQNWFNSMESKDFPPEMLQEATQQRKQRKQIIGTAQVWQRVAKPLREQVQLLYKPITIFGCLTIVRQYKPTVTDEGQVDKLSFRGMFFFVHDEDLRNSFDTLKAIKQISMKGWKPRSEQIRNLPQNTIKVVSERK